MLLNCYAILVWIEWTPLFTYPLLNNTNEKITAPSLFIVPKLLHNSKCLYVHPPATLSGKCEFCSCYFLVKNLLIFEHLFLSFCSSACRLFLVRHLCFLWTYSSLLLYIIILFYLLRFLAFLSFLFSLPNETNYFEFFSPYKMTF